ncbi:MAG: hypothetical protein ACC661_07960, partial [Verrucomicrobiales bacterium]
MKPAPQSASATTPVLIILGIIALSAAAFFLFTRPALEKIQPEEKAASSPGGAASAASAANPPSAKGQGHATASSDKSAANPIAKGVPKTSAAASTKRKPYSSSKELLGDIATAVAAGDADAVIMLLGQNEIADGVLERLRTLVTQGQFKPVAEEPLVAIGSLGTLQRFSMHLARPASGALPAESVEVLFELDRNNPFHGWMVTGVRIPRFTVLANPPPSQSPGTKSAPATPTAPSGAKPITPSATVAAGSKAEVMVIEGDRPPPEDPLMVAHRFVQALAKRDFAAAKALLDDDKVTEEKLAGLLIVTEEGEFRLLEDNPLVATAVREDAAWVIARLGNAEGRADFGLELERDKTTGAWKIAALNLDRLLAARSLMTNADSVPYSPIVKNPQGGDSLVLYFAYDGSSL